MLGLDDGDLMTTIECDHDWRFSGDIKYCIKCKKGESMDWSKNYKLTLGDSKQ